MRPRHPGRIITAAILIGLLVLVIRDQPAFLVRGESAATPAAPGACGEALGIGDSSVSCVAFVDASTDTGATAVSLDNSVVARPLAFPEETGFLAVPAGTHAIHVSPASDPSRSLYSSQGTVLKVGKAYVVVLLGSVPSDTFDVSILGLGSPGPAPGSGIIRVVQAVGDAPGITISCDGKPVARDVRALDVTGPVSVGAGDHRLAVGIEGVANPLFPVRDVTVPDGGTVIVVIAGTMTNPAGVITVSVTLLGAANRVPQPATPVLGTPIQVGTPEG